MIFRFFIHHLDYKSILINEFIGFYLTNVDLGLFNKKTISLEKFKTFKKNTTFFKSKDKALYFGKNFAINGIQINIETNSIKEFRKFFNESTIKAEKLTVNLFCFYFSYSKRIHCI